MSYYFDFYTIVIDIDIYVHQPWLLEKYEYVYRYHPP
jgi:hypothetical protein